jgi:hypothetical protein
MRFSAAEGLGPCAARVWKKRALGWEASQVQALLERASSVNAHSKWTRSLIASRCPGAASASVIHYGGSVEGLPEDPSGGEGAPGPYILCVARIAKHKGLDILLMAFSKLVEEGEGAHLVLCGEDYSDGHLGRVIRLLRLEGRVHYLGRLPRGQILTLMRGCLFLAAPSRKEGMGMAIIEAMQAGKAVLATRVGGIPELVRDGRDGILVESQDVESLTEAMRRLLRDPESRRRMGESGRERSAELGWGAALDAYTKLYGARGEGPLCVVLWGHLSDPTTQTMAQNIAEGLLRRGLPPVVCAWRSRWSEPFRSVEDGVVCYRLGLPCMGWPLLDDLVMLSQLLWIRRRERAGLWHAFILNYVRLRGLVWFAGLTKDRPLLTLA